MNKDKSETGLQKGDWLTDLEEFTGVRIDERRQLPPTTFLLIDCSGSMATDNKLPQAKEGGKAYAVDASRKEYSVGLIEFGSNARLILSPKYDLAEFNRRIAGLEINGSTNMAAAIEIGLQQLADNAGIRVLCIASDGHPDDRDATLRAAGKAKKAGIEIMTIGTPDADYEFLKKLATRTDLAIEVKNHQLQEGIKSMAKLLPS